MRIAKGAIWRISREYDRVIERMCTHLSSLGAGSGCPLPTMVTIVTPPAYSPTDNDGEERKGMMIMRTSRSRAGCEKSK